MAENENQNEDPENAAEDPGTPAAEPAAAEPAPEQEVQDPPPAAEPAAETVLEKSEGRLKRAADFIKNTYVVMGLVTLVIGGGAKLYWEYKGEPDLREFILATITDPGAEERLRTPLIRTLLDVDETYAASVMQKRQEEAQGNGEQPYKAKNLVQSAFKANEIDEMREKVDSWHTFSFYRMFPSKGLKQDDRLRLVADTNAGQLHKIWHDIMIHPQDNLLLYIRPNSETLDGRAISSAPFEGLKIAGEKFRNVERLLQLDAVPLNCYLVPRGDGYNLAQGRTGLKPIRIELMPGGGDQSDKEFHFNVYVLSSKKSFDRSNCDA